MRLLATRTPEWAVRKGITRVLLVTGSELDETRYRGQAIVYAYDSDEDGPSSTGWLYEDVEHALSELEQEWAISRACWRPIPNQLPGCELDWIAPVRIRDAGPKGVLRKKASGNGGPTADGFRRRALLVCREFRSAPRRGIGT